jgi:DNA-binding winged helix-turn-helix (wHTH) protein
MGHMKHVTESAYPVSFRKKEAGELGSQLKHHHSVVLVGMKRVGISNFLRFFLNHQDIAKTYIKNESEQFFVQVDLNDLIERNILAFWTLLLTRLVDSVQSSTLPESAKRQCRRLFVQSIQLKDHFFTVDSVRKVLDILVTAGLYPMIFFIRFDRLQEVVTPEFFSNLLGLRDAAKHKLSYVFTSFRPLHDLAPDVFRKQFLSVFSRDMYLTPATHEDMNIIMATLEGQYHTELDAATGRAIVDLSGGYVQYLQLALIRLKEETKKPKNAVELSHLLSKDEQVIFQSEELFESLTKAEKEVLLAVQNGKHITQEERKNGEYLWNTGMVVVNRGKTHLFSPLFAEYVKTMTGTEHVNKEFTKKEHLLFTFLKEHENELCERETIIEAVWPEHEELGVSDWAIDRLVARLRTKLKDHGSPYQIVTVVTRGYKLIKS